jgi:CIC family chloride channel protein
MFPKLKAAIHKMTHPAGAAGAEKLGDFTTTPRVIWISSLAAGIGLVSAFIALFLLKLIAFFTNLFFFQRWSIAPASPAANHLGAWEVAVPVIGALIIGLMARYGSERIRGHGIPEAIEAILINGSKVEPKVAILKPLSSAISIGSGGPFGAEGPIIATGGALGSLIGQLLKTTADERKILLSAGAAAGMAATFGSPVSGVLIAIELLLFEFRSRSLIPVTFACVTATAVRMAFMGSAPIFAMPTVTPPTQSALILYIVLGAIVGVASVGVTRAVYLI